MNAATWETKTLTYQTTFNRASKAYQWTRSTSGLKTPYQVGDTDVFRYVSQVLTVLEKLRFTDGIESPEAQEMLEDYMTQNKDIENVKLNFKQFYNDLAHRKENMILR